MIIESALGVDVGGTTTRVALVACGHAPETDSARIPVERRVGFPAPFRKDPSTASDEGPTHSGSDGAWAEATTPCSILECETTSTMSLAGYTGLVRWIAEVTDAMSLGAGVRPPAIGIAVPGILNADATGVVRSVNVPFLEGRNIAGQLSALTGRRVQVVTDADAATWGEWTAIAPRLRRFAHLRFGTGVGCGVLLDGALCVLEREPGRHATALVVERGPEAVACSCGGRGCLEAYASGRALVGELAKRGYPPSLELLRNVGDAGPESLREIRDRAVTAIVTAIENLVGAHALDRIVVGGGVLESAGDWFQRIAERYRAGPERSRISRRELDPPRSPLSKGGSCGQSRDTETESALGAEATAEETPIRRAVLGDGAGVIGAALLVHAAPHSARATSSKSR